MIAKRILTEQEFQEFVDWDLHQRYAQVQYWYPEKTLYDLWPLLPQAKDRREDTEIGLRHFFGGGEIWVCRGKDGKIHHANLFILDRENKIATNFWTPTDWDYHHSLAPVGVPGGMPIADPYAEYTLKVVSADLLRRGITKIEFEYKRERYLFDKTTGRQKDYILKIGVMHYDKFSQCWRYWVLVDIAKMQQKQRLNRRTQDALKQAEEL